MQQEEVMERVEVVESDEQNVVDEFLGSKRLK